MFRDRFEAGRQLAEALRDLRGEDVVVLGLPRGGVPVAYEVAAALAAPLDVIVVRKLGVPFQPELAMGAVGEDGVRVVNYDLVASCGLEPAEVETVEARERAELERRARRFRRGKQRLSVEGRIALVVDDGIATGSTARAACQVARALGARRVVLAVPVAPPATLAGLAGVADDVVCLEAPQLFVAVGQWYEEFSQVSDDEVVALLDRADSRLARADAQPGAPADPSDPTADLYGQARLTGRDEEVQIPVGRLQLSGHLAIPARHHGLVVFAHGSGSSRTSPRNRYVAAVLNESGLGTLLFDLLTLEEELDRGYVFDIGLLAERLAGATTWLQAQVEAKGHSIGYFGASTGAAAALTAAAEPGSQVAAVVSRGGRPDLAGRRLEAVRAPTLLIVGGADRLVLELNEKALSQLRCERELVVVPGATHLFEEPGALEQVAHLAAVFFRRQLT